MMIIPTHGQHLRYEERYESIKKSTLMMDKAGGSNNGEIIDSEQLIKRDTAEVGKTYLIHLW